MTLPCLEIRDEDIQLSSENVFATCWPSSKSLSQAERRAAIWLEGAKRDDHLDLSTQIFILLEPKD